MANSWADLDIGNPTYWPLVGTQINTTGGSGTGAVVFAIAFGGIITSLNIISGGSGYVSNFSPTITGTGTGASVTLTVSGGKVTGYSSLVGGTGYLGTAPALALNSPTNFVSTLLASLASWRAPVNGNQQALSNLGPLTLVQGAGIINPGYIQLPAQDLPGTTYTITAASWSGGVATFTTSAATRIAVGQLINVTGISPGGYNATMVQALSGTTGTTVKISVTVNPGAYVSGGTILVDGVNAAAGMVARDADGFIRFYGGSIWFFLNNSAITQAQKFATTFVNGNNNNFNPNGVAFITGTGPTAAFAITGIVPLGTVAGGLGDGQKILIMNNTAQQLTIPYNSASSAAGNKILNATVADIVLTNSGEGNGFEAIYRVDLGVWQVINTFHP